jgi:hypothetical protein
MAPPYTEASKPTLLMRQAAVRATLSGTVAPSGKVQSPLAVRRCADLVPPGTFGGYARSHKPTAFRLCDL